MAETFADRLRSLLREQHLSQQAVADAVGVSQASVSNWLRGTIPNGAELYRLAKFFRRSMEWFMQSEPASPLPKVDSREWADWDKCDSPLHLSGDKLKAIPGIPLSFWERAADLFRDNLVEVKGGQIIITPRGGEGSRNILTASAMSEKVSAMRSEMPQLLERLRRATQARGRKVALARKLKVPLASVSRWIHGHRKPGPEISLKLKRLFDERASPFHTPPS